MFRENSSHSSPKKIKTGIYLIFRRISKHISSKKMRLFIVVKWLADKSKFAKHQMRKGQKHL